MRMRSRTLVDRYDNCGKQHCVSIPVCHISVQVNLSAGHVLELTLEHKVAMLCRSS